MCDGPQHSWGWLTTCFPLGPGEIIPCFTFLMQLFFVRLFIYLLICLHFNPWVFSHLPFHFFPPFHWQEVSELLWGFELLTGAKSWQKYKTGCPESRDQTTLTQENLSSWVSSLNIFLQLKVCVVPLSYFPSSLRIMLRVMTQKAASATSKGDQQM